MFHCEIDLVFFIIIFLCISVIIDLFGKLYLLLIVYFCYYRFLMFKFCCFFCVSSSVVAFWFDALKFSFFSTCVVPLVGDIKQNRLLPFFAINTPSPASSSSSGRTQHPDTPAHTPSCLFSGSSCCFSYPYQGGTVKT